MFKILEVRERKKEGGREIEKDGEGVTEVERRERWRPKVSSNSRENLPGAKV